MLWPVPPVRGDRPFLRSSNILIDGNSIVTEDYAGLSGGIAKQVQSILSMQGIPVTAGWIAVSGQTTPMMIADAAVQVDGLLKTPPFRDATSRILLVFEGTNDLVFKGPTVPNRVAECYQNLRDYCYLRRSAGWYVILMGNTPRSHGYDASASSAALYEADMLALDRLCADNWPECANLWFHTRKLVPTYKAIAPYADDPAHPNAYGCGLIASALASFLMDNLRID
jgi:lysophospholipase L1-like esterase